MDINHILASPDRDLEIRKLLDKGPWKHKWKHQEYNRFGCQKCGGIEIWRDNKRIRKHSCPVPDPIALDWNLAMKMRDEVIGRAKVGTVKYHKAMMKLSPYQDQANTGFWGIIYAQPHHYILAAIEAKRGAE
ncbi:hypothetical protein LCGC14_0358870 [marine sediment metagenome]|uniref:Uncharacterized protein n=1 Tax=marine sediment metagenome TaxID=412755 RepID=A0A0F9TRN4_9ZZZZ